MTIKAALLSWDTKSAEDIEGIYRIFLTSPSDQGIKIERVIVSLIELIKDDSDKDLDHLQQGATWLLKHHLQIGRQLKPKVIDDLIDSLFTLKSWQAKLHLLQCFSFFPVKNSQKKTVEQFLRQCLMDKNKFVRAWAYGGFYNLSLLYPEYTSEVTNFIELAMKDEVPSVKARLRNLLKSQ